MKKTLTINLNGIVFNIDDNAYDVLSKYLSDIASHFSSDEDRADIMNDIEARISELFNERLQRNKEVITLADVQEIIGIMGNPNQFSEHEENEDPQKQDKKKKRSRRFYRDPENAILSGVCGGLAAHFDLDVTIVRLALVALTVFSGIFGGIWFILLAYFLAWIIAPKAVTASQRLEMQGEEVTVENIKAEFNNFKNYVESEKFKESTRSVGLRLAEIFKWILKISLGFLGAVLAFVGFVVILALFAALVSVIFAPATVFEFIPDYIFEWTLFTPEKMIMFVISLILVVGCPIFLLIYGLIRLASGHRSKSKTTHWVTLVLWLAGVFMLISTTTKSALEWKNREVQSGSLKSLCWSGSGLAVDQVRDIPPFKSIDVAGGFEVELNHSPNQLLMVSAKEGLLSNITTVVENETLFIRSSVLNGSTKISLSTDTLESVTTKGAVKIQALSPLRGENLNMTLKGASKVNLEVYMEHEIKVNAEGVAELDVKGGCETLELNARGAVHVEAKDLIARNAEVRVEGASLVSLYASENLNADAAGAAMVTCFGSPKKVNKTDRIASSIIIK